MKNRIVVVLLLFVLLTSMLSLPLITCLAAEGSGDSVYYQESIGGAGGVAPSKAAVTQNGPKSLQDDWLNIFRNSSSSETTQNWDFNNTNAWLSSAYSDGNNTRLIVGLSNNRLASILEVSQIVARHNAKIVNTVSFNGEAAAEVVELPLTSVTSFVGEINEANLASYVEPNMKMQTQLIPNDSYWSVQWGPQKIQADWAWNTTTGDSSVLVAVVDTGIDYSHPELTANYVPLGFDWVNNDADPIDDCGHGTHCAGIIAAAINNNIGISGLAQVRIMAEKVLGYSGGGYDDWVANGIIHAVDQGAKIISMSLGGEGDSELIHDAVRYAYSAGVLVIAAAGNNNANTKSYPAAYDEVVAVAATDQNDFKAGFSNWGDWIELAAPGVDIYSTLPTYQVYLNDLGYSMNYDYLSGTSMACPHVAGTAALLWSRYPAKSRDWIRSWLRYTADDLGDPGFDQYYGYGRINARNAVEQTPPAHELILSSWATSPYVEPGKTGFVNVSVLNFGESDETYVKVELLANDSVASDTLIDFLPSGGLATVSLAWNPAIEGSYNITAYVVPVAGETSIGNNALSKIIFVGTPVKAVVLRSYGNIERNSVTNWQTLNNQWQLFGDRMVYVDYETLNKKSITYDDIVATGADVLIISCASDSYSGWEFADSEINAIASYVHEGHGLIATAGTFYYWVPNNNKLMPLFGMNQNVSYYSTTTDLLHLFNLTHPLFDDVPDPFVFPTVASAVPASSVWDSDELSGGKYLAIGHFNESAVVTYRGLVYISSWLETIPPYYHHHLKLFYNAIIWSRYQKPPHELDVSLDSPVRLNPGESTLLNATVANRGSSNETNVELSLFVNTVLVDNVTIPQLPEGSSYTLSYSFTSPAEGKYNITAYAPIVPGEESADNNIITKTLLVLRIAVKNVLVYSDDYAVQPSLRYVIIALNDLGINYTYYADDPWGFSAALQSQTWDLVIVDHCNYFALQESWPLLDTYVQDGGLLILSTFAVDNPTNLWNTLGASWASEMYNPEPVYRWMPEHAIFTSPNTVGDLTSYEEGYWDDGDHVAATSGTSVAGFSSSPVPDNGGIVLGNTYQTVLFSFILDEFRSDQNRDGRLDAVEMWENAVTYLAAGYEHELAVKLAVPTFMQSGSLAMLNATVLNKGADNETNVELQLMLDGTLVASELLQGLPSGSSYTLNYLWTPTIEGTYNITAYAPPAQNETMLTNNVATRFVTVAQPLIHPIEGQYADYLIYLEDPASGYRYEMGWNFTYVEYISPYQMNVTTVQYQQGLNYSFTGWMIVNIFNRLVEYDSGIGWRGFWYPGWIETNVNIGSMISLLSYNVTVTGSKPILVGNRLIDCWEIQLGFSGFAYEFWYDKASGLWIAMDATYGTQIERLMLQDTNVPIGISYDHELAVTLDAPSRVELGENATLDATVYNVGLNDETNVRINIIINDTTVDYASISTLHASENYTLSYLWTPAQASSYNVTAYVPPVPGEQWTDNNALTSISHCFYNQYTRTYAPPEWIGGGTAMNWHADDISWQYTIPFYFPFYGVSHSDIYISSNGLITFNSPDLNYSNSISGLAQKFAIAPAWDDWRTDIYPGDDIYIWQPDSNHVVIRWQASASYDTGIIANFEVVLGSDGIIKFDYGENNGPISATLGISNGEGEILAEEAMGLNYINTILFTPRAPTQPEHELAVSLEVPSLVMLGDHGTLNATVYNFGLSNETEVELRLLIDGSIVDSVTTPELSNGSSYRLSYLWTPTMAGSFTIVAYAPPVPNETSPGNNLVTKIVPVTEVHYSVEPIAIAPLTDANASVYGLETPPSPSPIGQNFTVEIHLKNATLANTPYGLEGVEVHFYFGNILNYCTPIGFTDELGQAGGVLVGPLLYPLPAGFYDDNFNPVDTPPYTNATFFLVAAASLGGPWWGDDGLVAKITFQITAQPLDGLPDFYAPLGIPFADLVDANVATVPFGVVQGTLRIDGISLPPALPGDLDGDGKVTLSDLTLLANAYGSKPGDPNWNPNADIAEPLGIIGLTDLVTLAIYYGRSIS